ncbi:protein kinase [Nonomuraea sp. NN258]|uniref:protein kinase domain-containing protein n=1 Tax=Nonomuraea antri TaxID=2730852 RepID=UPI00156A598B|nr:protein kinase [Nonomuraea antri]NRQ30528.1 protein kinase [Nonomuraea antri]
MTGDPQRLGGYWLAGRLGAGGQGVVYEAYAEDGRRVAIKVLHGDQAAQLAREATAAQRVAAFCTAPVIEAVLEGPRPYIVSEYVEGPSLRKAVADGRRFTGTDLHRLATAVATALTAIHDAGVIHRDLKPDNVLLGPDGPRVIDFGIARTAEMSLTATGLVTGTPTYMAPEVFTGQRAGMPADVFAWGGIMVHAATGADPFEAESLGGVMHRVLSANPDLGALPDSVRPLVAAALGKDPARRPTARQLLLALVSGDSALDTAYLLARGSGQAAGMAVAADDPGLGALAEQAYESLSREEHEAAAEVFLRLVTVGEGGELSVRRAALSELMEGRPLPESAAVARILDVFGYLLGRDGEEVWLSRPALPHAWPRYRRWIEANRDGLAVHREILSAARRWHQAGRRDGDLFQNHSLQNALHWAATARRNITLSPVERDFLDAGAQLTRRKARRNRLVTLSLAGLLVIALVAAGLAVQQGRLADERAEAVAAQRDRAEGTRLAQVADGLRQRDPRVAMQLSVAAWRLAGTPQARAALTAALAQREVAVFKDPATAGETVRALSRDGRILASASDDAIRLWDPRTGKRAGGFTGLGLKDESPVEIAVSPTGRDVLLTTTRRLIVWRAATGEPVRSRPIRGDVQYYGRYGTVDRYVMITYTDDVGVRHDHVWDLDRDTFASIPAYDGAMTEKGEAIYVRADGARGEVERRALPGLEVELSQPPAGVCHCRAPLAVTAGGGDLIEESKGDLVVNPVKGARSSDDTLQTGVRPWNRGDLTVSPDGRLFASVTDSQIQVWRAFDEHLTTLRLPTGADNGQQRAQVGFDGTRLRYLSEDRVFTVDLGDLPLRPAAPAPWSPPELGQGARLLAMHDDDGKIYLSDERGAGMRPVIEAEPGGNEVRSPVLAFGPDGRLAGMGGGTIAVIDVAARREAARWRPMLGGRPQHTGLLAFSQAGTLLAAGHFGADGDASREALAVWDWKTRRLLWSARFTNIRGAKFAPDGRTLAVIADTSADVAGYDLRLYDTATGRRLGAPFGQSGQNSTVIDFVFSRDGSSVAVVDGRGRVTVFDLATRTQIGQIDQGGELVGEAAASPREDVVAVATRSGRVRLFDMKAGVNLGFLRDGDVGGLAALSFSADGTGVTTLDNTGVLRHHPIEPGAMAAAVCARAGRPLTEAEWRAHVTGVPYRQVCP